MKLKIVAKLTLVKHCAHKLLPISQISDPWIQSWRSILVRHSQILSLPASPRWFYGWSRTSCWARHGCARGRSRSRAARRDEVTLFVPVCDTSAKISSESSAILNRNHDHHGQSHTLSNIWKMLNKIKSIAERQKEANNNSCSVCTTRQKEVSSGW